MFGGHRHVATASLTMTTWYILASSDPAGRGPVVLDNGAIHVVVFIRLIGKHCSHHERKMIFGDHLKKPGAFIVALTLEKYVSKDSKGLIYP